MWGSLNIYAGSSHKEIETALHQEAALSFNLSDPSVTQLLQKLLDEDVALLRTNGHKISDLNVHIAFLLSGALTVGKLLQPLSTLSSGK